MEKIIRKYSRLIDKNEDFDKISAVEEVIVDSFDEAINEENFYSLPIKNILDCFTLDDCIRILSCLEHCPICTKLNELYREELQLAERDYEHEISEMKKEIKDLNKRKTESVFSPVTEKPRNFIENIHFAARIGNLASVQYLFEVMHVNVEEKDESGFTPLYYATMKGCLLVVKYLIEHCRVKIEEKTKDGKTLVNIAALYCSGEVLKYYIEECHANPKTISKMALHYACDRNNTDVVKYLIEKCGIKVNAKDTDRNTPFIISTMKNHIDVAKLLFNEYNADVEAINKSGNNALHYAVANNNLEFVKFLIETCKAKIDIKSANGDTPLLIACQKGYLPVVKYLLVNCKAKVNVSNISMRTPLHYIQSILLSKEKQKLMSKICMLQLHYFMHQSTEN